MCLFLRGSLYDLRVVSEHSSGYPLQHLFIISLYVKKKAEITESPVYVHYFESLWGQQFLGRYSTDLSIGK